MREGGSVLRMTNQENAHGRTLSTRMRIIALPRRDIDGTGTKDARCVVEERSADHNSVLPSRPKVPSPVFSGTTPQRHQFGYYSRRPNWVCARRYRPFNPFLRELTEVECSMPGGGTQGTTSVMIETRY